MTRARCIGEPISWLRIERYVLGELPEGEAHDVRDHLGACPVCRACADDARLPRAMPKLPALTPRPRAPKPSPWPRRVALVTSTLAAAAAVVFAVWPRGQGDPVAPRPDIRVRGGDVALVVLREHLGEVVENPEVFGAPDRFRVAITCPPGHDTHARVFVVQGDEAALALETGADFRCGNRVALDGAFRITGGGEAHVCVVFADPPPLIEGAALARWLTSDESGAVCRSMVGAP